MPTNLKLDGNIQAPYITTDGANLITVPASSGTMALNSVASGGTGLTSTTAYAVLCGGTTSTSAFQSIASVGTSGQVLTSNGAGTLPTFQAISPSNGSVGAWVNFDGTGTVAIRASGNVTSITDNGVGDYTINITLALTDANFSATATCGYGGSVSFTGSNAPYAVGPVTISSSSFRFQTGQGAVGSQSGTAIDCQFVFVTIVR